MKGYGQTGKEMDRVEYCTLTEILKEASGRMIRGLMTIGSKIRAVGPLRRRRYTKVEVKWQPREKIMRI